MPKVSVVMPVYNTEKYLRASVDCILGQTLKDIEVILVDDSSTDDSLKILREYEDRDKRVKVITQENAGAGAARNNGLSVSTGEYLFFFDSDDLCEKNLLELTVKQAEKTGADMVAFNYDKFFEDGTVLELQGVYPEWLTSEVRKREVFSYKDCKDLILTIVNVTPWNKIYRADFVKSGGYKFDEISSTNDIAFSAVTTAAAEKISFLEKIFVHYRVGHGNTITSSKMKKLHNVTYAVNSAITQIQELPYATEIEKGVIDFELGNYFFAWQKIITDFSDENAKKFYETIHERFCSNFYKDKTKSDFANDGIYQFFEIIKNTGYEEMLLMKQKKIIVSFTTYPARISCVPKVYESITAQSMKPDKVVLWLSKDQFPNEMDDLPLEVRELSALDIRFVEDDLKPHKKYFYAFKEFPEDLVITIDDDLLYDYFMIENLYNSYLQYPKYISTMRTHLMLITEDEKLLPYGSWPMECSILLNAPSHQLFSTNGAGTIFPPHVFDEIDDIFYDKETIKATCLMADDLWIKAAALLSDVPIVLAAPCTNLRYVEGSQEEGLRYMNLDQNANDVQWKKISDFLISKYGKDILMERLTKSQEGERLIGIGRLSEYFVNAYKDAKETARLKAENEWLWSQVNSKAFKLGSLLAKPVRFIKELK